MGPAAPLPPERKTIADWLALPNETRVELIDGSFVEKAAPTSEHSVGQFGLSDSLRPVFHRRGDGSGRNGGWWILGDVAVKFGTSLFLPDLVGWRRERVPELPRMRPVDVRPDWVCEVVSESNRRNDVVLKLRRYHQAGVPHLWIVDSGAACLTDYRWTPDGYLVATTSQAGEFARLEPFEALELRVGLLFGEDPDDPPAPPPAP